MTLDTLSLQMVLATAQAKSFTKAAKAVNRTQSAVSQQILKLERTLGTPLFHRGKELTLTHEGEVFVSYAKTILALHQEVLTRFQEDTLEGEVRFGLPEDFASLYLARVLSDYTEIHPKVRLHVECDLTLNLFERFKKKEFDLVLVKMENPKDFPNGQEVWSEPLVWVGHESKLKDESPIPLVLAPEPCVFRSIAIQALEEKRISWRIAFSSPSFQGNKAAVQAGMGITVLPAAMVPKDLFTIRSKSLPKLKHLHASLLKHVNDSLPINSFEAFVKSHLSAV